MRFIHAADIHLDSPLRGLEFYEEAPLERLRGATREALKRLVQLCLNEQVDFLVIAGDLFDHDWKDFHTPLFVANQLQRLERVGVPVFVIHGNHDSVHGMSRSAPWPGNVQVFDHRKPETRRLESLQVALHGQSFPKREVTDNLVPHYPAPIRDWFNIGLLHTNANGSPNHDSYAPCSVPELVAKGYDYWALGHVHDYQILNREPYVVYSGNTQGRHVRETGAKGCALISVDGHEVRNVEFHETGVLRWSHETIQLSQDDGVDELHDLARLRLRELAEAIDGKYAAVRLEFTGRCRAHQRLARDATRQEHVAHLRVLAGEFSDALWVEKIKFRTSSRLDLDAWRQGHGVVAELLREIESIATDPQQLVVLAETLKPLVTKVAVDVKDQAGGEAIDFEDPQQLQAWLREAEALLVTRLVENDEP